WAEEACPARAADHADLERVGAGDERARRDVEGEQRVVAAIGADREAARAGLTRWARVRRAERVERDRRAAAGGGGGDADAQDVRGDLTGGEVEPDRRWVVDGDPLCGGERAGRAAHG